MLEGIKVDGEILDWKSPLELLFWGDVGLRPEQNIEAKKTPVLVGRNGTGKSLTAALIEKGARFLAKPNPSSAAALGKLMKKFKVDSIEFAFSNFIHRDTNGYAYSTLPIGFDLGDDWVDCRSSSLYVELMHNSKFVVTIDEKGQPILTPSQVVTTFASIDLDEEDVLLQPEHIKAQIGSDSILNFEESYEFNYDGMVWNTSSYQTMLDVMLVESLKFAQAALTKIGVKTVNLIDPKNKDTLPVKYLSIHGYEAVWSLYNHIHPPKHQFNQLQELRYTEYPLAKEITQLSFVNIDANRSVEVTWDIHSDMHAYNLAREYIQFGHIATPVFQHPQEVRGFYKIYRDFRESCSKNHPVVHLSEVEKYEGPMKNDLVKQLTYDLWQYFGQIHSETVPLMYLHHALGIEPPFEDPIPTGIQNLIFITAKVMNAAPNSIVFIDEPEIALHRDLQSRVTHLLRLIRADISIIFATHNIEVMNSMPESLIELPTKEL